MTQYVVKGSQGEVLRSLLAETRAAPLMVEDMLGRTFSPLLLQPLHRGCLVVYFNGCILASLAVDCEAPELVSWYQYWQPQV